MESKALKKTLDIRREARECPTCGQRFSRDGRFCPFDGVKLEPATRELLGDALIGGTIDGRYEVIELLGEGGTGRVYKVRHAALNRLFAMKILRRDLARDEELAARFIQEAKATASVHHPNVIAITDFGNLPDGVPFMVTELLVGRTLGEVIKAEGPMRLSRAAHIVKQIAGALGAAHAAGIVHRDLKPDNVFLVDGTRNGADKDSARTSGVDPAGDLDEVRVVDFGAAKVVGASRLTRDGIVFGTPHYMSPEQASGQPVDCRSDLYSLGVIMYEMFTGRVPFEADTYMGVLTQHMFVQPVPPSEVAPVASELGGLEEITLVCLAKKPEGRYPSMDRFAAEVDRALAGLDLAPVSGRAAVGARSAAMEGPSEIALGEMPVVLPRQRVPWGWIAFGGAGLALIGVALAWVGREPARATDRWQHTALQGGQLEGISSVNTVPLAVPPAPSVSPSVGPTTSFIPIPGASTGRPLPARRAPAPPRRAGIDDVGDPFIMKR
jgi:tRNA A-37 threonylcarbamoyl transferase component Bud32